MTPAQRHAVEDHRGPDAGAERQHSHVAAAAGRAVRPLARQRRVGVVDDEHWQIHDAAYLSRSRPACGRRRTCPPGSRGCAGSRARRPRETRGPGPGSPSRPMPICRHRPSAQAAMRLSAAARPWPASAGMPARARMRPADTSPSLISVPPTSDARIVIAGMVYPAARAVNVFRFPLSSRLWHPPDRLPSSPSSQPPAASSSGTTRPSSTAPTRTSGRTSGWGRRRKDSPGRARSSGASRAPWLQDSSATGSAGGRCCSSARSSTPPRGCSRRCRARSSNSSRRASSAAWASAPRR